jgi:four helix bundle protein
MEDPATFQTFENLDAYKAAREFRKAVYAVSRQLPDFEKFELASQIRRAAVSLTNNIAEGHGRFHYLDQIKFMLQLRGSLEELQGDLNVCEDEKYLPPSDIAKLKAEACAFTKFSMAISAIYAVARRTSFIFCTTENQQMIFPMTNSTNS